MTLIEIFLPGVADLPVHLIITAPYCHIIPAGKSDVHQGIISGEESSWRKERKIKGFGLLKDQESFVLTFAIIFLVLVQSLFPSQNNHYDILEILVIKTPVHHGSHQPKLTHSFAKHFSLFTAMSILKKINLRQLKEVKQLLAQIFGETYNPQNVRNGAKVLRAPLKGPEVVSWYGVNDAAPTFKDFKEWFPELRLVDPKEAYRVKMVADRKKRNKGAPKKKSS